MPSHSPAPAEVSALISSRINSGHYPDLVESAATINALFAFAEDGKPAVKLHGSPCHAVIKINGPKERLQGLADATIIIDGKAWNDEWTEEQQIALIDHECHHLIVCRHKPTKKDPLDYILSDDAGRPKMKMRAHDLQFGWFLEIARRHGAASFERQQARTIRDEHGQLLWAWGDDNAPGDEVPRIELHDAGDGDEDEGEGEGDEDEDAA